MNIIVCLDEKMGMQFNGRRQSRDRILIEYLLDRIRLPLFIQKDSLELFEDFPEKIRVSDDFSSLKDGEYGFIENPEFIPDPEKIQQILCFRWNRNYPADTYFPFSLSSPWILTETEDFKGSSHEKITLEVYRK